MGAVLTGVTVPVAVSPVRALPEPSERATPLVPVTPLARSREGQREAAETRSQRGTAAYARARRKEAAAVRALNDEAALRSLSAAFTPRDAEATAYDDLNHALFLAKERGEQVPCVGPGADAWTANDAIDQELAADLCLLCPVFAMCQRYADEAKPTGGTWAGVTRDPVRRVASPKIPDKTSIVPQYPGMFSLKTRAKRPATKRSDTPMSTKATTTQIPATTCACQCGEQVGRKAMYRPGHDARHAGIVARAIAADPKQAKALLATLPTLALQAKAQHAVERIAAKAQATSKAEATK